MVASLAQSRAVLEESGRMLAARSERLEMLNRELHEANRLKSEFLAQVSHELRTPLNVIIGYTELLADGGAGAVSPEQTEILASIDRYSKQQLDLVTEVLDLARLSSGRVSLHVERFALKPVLAEIVGLYHAGTGNARLQLVLEASPDVPVLETDRVKLLEIVRNLVDNAVKFTQAGTVTVAARCDDAAERVVIEVRDTGPGIPAEDLEAIFDEFRQLGETSTRATHGVGLGLSIVKRLAEVLGGSVSVTSRVGEGSTFRVEVPVRLPPLEGRDAA
jgi:signal transduction histidine kinase